MFLFFCAKIEKYKEQEVKRSQKLQKQVLKRHHRKLANINPRKHTNRIAKDGRVQREQDAMDNAKKSC